MKDQQHDLNNQNQEQSFNESFSRYLDNQIDICNNIKNSSDIEKLLEFSDLIDLNSSNSYSEINNNQANQALPLKINSPNTLDNNVTTTKAEIKDMLKASVLTEIISNANNTDSICQSVESQKIIELERLLKAKDCEIRFLKKLVSHYGRFQVFIFILRRFYSISVLKKTHKWNKLFTIKMKKFLKGFKLNTKTL